MGCGFFISFEGIDGAGKTTQVKRLAARLAALGLEVLTVREPGGTELGEAIRRILQDPGNVINARTETCLYAAARAELVAQVILPSLQAGKVVLADRFADSTVAYQGAGRGLPEEQIVLVNALVTQRLKPDLTILIDLPVGEALARAGRTKTHDRMEMLGHSFFARVREGYLRLASSDPARFVVLNGTKAPAELEGDIFEAVQEALKRCTGISGDKMQR
ncbi:MAG: dTMP kinase [Bacillota bacterium]